MKREGGRRWSFAGCSFDEANWTLTVDGQRAAVETKPLELLRELLLNAGNLVSKDELMDRVWPDVEVVEASLPTAVGKLRRALHDDRSDHPIIETVPKIGYRLAVPVTVEECAAPAGSSAASTAPAPGTEVAAQGRARPRWLALGGAAALAIVAIALVFGPLLPVPANVAAPHAFTEREVHMALRKVDQDRVEAMIAAGWNPDEKVGIDRNNALNILLENCEWDPGGDPRRLLVMARTLIDNGASYADHNSWGDTAYSIAKADRYCGPNHPVTRMLERLCRAPTGQMAKRCLADYHRDPAGKVMRQDAPSQYTAVHMPPTATEKP